MLILVYLSDYYPRFEAGFEAQLGTDVFRCLSCHHDVKKMDAIDVRGIYARVSPLNHVRVILDLDYKTDDREHIRSEEEALLLLVKDAVKRHWEDARWITVRFRQR